MSWFNTFIGVLLFAVSVASAAQSNASGGSGVSVPPPQFAVSPPRFMLEIGSRPVGGAIRLYNISNRPVQVVASASHFDLDSQNRVRVIPPTAQSLDQWLVYNPTRMRIEPGKEQVVRFSIRPKAKPAPGEHRAMLFFTEDLGQRASAGGVQVKFRVGVAIYGMAAPVKSIGRLHSASLSRSGRQMELVLDVQSTGNAHVRLNGQYTLWRARDYPGLDSVGVFNVSEKGWNAPDGVVAGGPLPSLPVLGGTRRTIRTSFARPPAGRYRLAIKGLLADTNIDREITVTVN